MAIDTTYKELLIEQIIQEILLEGNAPSVSEIEERLSDFLDDFDVSLPTFKADTFKVEVDEVSSAEKFNQCNSTILRDLKVLYKHLLKISNQNTNNYHRWRTESTLLEKQLNDLEDRIESLLLISEDTAGYFNFIQDNFSTNTLVDLGNSTAFVNVDKGIVILGTNSIGATKIDLSSLKESDIEFNVLSKQNLVSVVQNPKSKKINIISDINTFWHERILTNKPASVSTEIKIDLKDTYELSRIDLDLHTSNQSSSIQITPMYSLDNYSYKQLPISTFTRSVTSKTSFQFPAIEARYIKFIMTKAGFDVQNNGQYHYEFGFDEITFYRETFADQSESILISEALSMRDENGTIEEFSKVALEVCEEVPENTTIDYYLAVSNTEDFPVSSGIFVGIDPLDRKNPTKPTVLDFGELDIVTVSGLDISYDSTSTTNSGIFINPSQSFYFIEDISGNSAITSFVTSSSKRYSTQESNERILSYSLSDDIDVAKNSLELWRNVSIKGSTNTVRGNILGWGYQEPYYKTTVFVENADGVDVDFGSRSIVLDGVKISGLVHFSYGRHLVEVHRDSWKNITASGQITDLEDLKLADTLYPYNQRFLVEGYSYDSAWPDADEKVYQGFDIVGEYLMDEVAALDFYNSVLKDDYSKFAIDHDIEDTNAIIDSVPAQTQPSSKVFIVKVDEENPDFINEKFLLKFKSASLLFKYLRFKAVLKTTDPDITPILDSYRIKISS